MSAIEALMPSVKKRELCIKGSMESMRILRCTGVWRFSSIVGMVLATSAMLSAAMAATKNAAPWLIFTD
jgi:hypothetical protein